MKKLIILSLLSATLLLSGCSAGYHDLTYSRSKDISWNDAQKIKLGMDITNVIKIMGKPREYNVVDGTPYFVYRIETLYGGDVGGALLGPGAFGAGAKIWQHPEGYIITIGFKNGVVSDISWERFKPTQADMKKAFLMHGGTT